METLLTIKNLSVRYNTERSKVYAVNNLSLGIAEGESLGLVGETGAGKTTTALAALNLLPKSATIQGDILYDGKSVFKMRERELLDLRGGKIAMIFQNPLTALNPVFPIGEQISMVLRAHAGMRSGQAMERAGELLELVGIPKYRLKDYPSQFSGGMRQRVGIAAALASNPKLLIADEPTTALDVTIQAQILELMKDLQVQYNTSLLMITHNLGIISELCQHVAVMYAGNIIEYGEVTKVFRTPMHPYTIGLLGALPKLTGPRSRLTAIPGRIADPQNLPSGCPFHPRCDKCREECRHKEARLTKTQEGHFVSCHQYEEVGA